MKREKYERKREKYERKREKYERKRDENAPRGRVKEELTASPIHSII
jgi:hypothetical protein